MNLIALISSVWILSLPFYHYSLVGSLSLDNIIGPMLFLLIAARVLIGAHSLSKEQLTNMALASATILIYLLTHTANLLGTQHAVWSSMHGIAKSMLYFLLPILIVNSERDLKRLSMAMVAVMVIGAISALMSALGLVSFDFARQAESRIQLDYIPKSVGLFTAYGDMALLVALAVLLALGSRVHELAFARARLVVGMVIVVSALVGIISMQSRNIILTVSAAILTYFLLGYWRRRGGAWVGKLYFSLLSVITVAVLAIMLFMGPLIDWVEGLGGTSEAAATVHARLEQYKFGWSLVEHRILLGADPATYESNELAVTFIHNMWIRELVQSGLLGIFAVMLFYYRAMRIQVARLKADSRSLARVYVAVLISSLVASQFYPANTPVYWVIMGLATALPSRRKREMTEVRAREVPVTRSDGLLLARRRSGGVGKL